MNRAAGFFITGVLCALSGGAVLAPAAWAVPITSLYVVMVPGSDPEQAAQEAMRVELVRLTGTRDSASDPALAALIDNAHQYVQLERSTTTGQVQLLFDEAALSAAIEAAGRTLWGADRPLLWIELPPQDPAAADAMRMRLSAAAEERGLPITIVSATGPTTAPPSAPSAPSAPSTPATTSASPTPGTPGGPAAPARPGAAPAAPAASAPAAPGAGPTAAAGVAPAAVVSLLVDPQAALQAARSAGASAALVAQPLTAQPDTLQWTLTSSDASGQWIGGPELAIDNATDALSSAARALDRAPVAQYACHIIGVNDLASLANVLAAIHAATGVTDVVVSDVDGDQLTLQLQVRGSAAQLQRALTSDRLQPEGTLADGALQYRYVPGP